MLNVPSKKILTRYPLLYRTRGAFGPIVSESKLEIHLYFCLLDEHWYPIEFDGIDTFYGYYTCDDPEEIDWKFFSFRSLQSLDKRVALCDIQTGDFVKWERRSVTCEIFPSPKSFGEIMDERADKRLKEKELCY